MYSVTSFRSPVAGAHNVVCTDAGKHYGTIPKQLPTECLAVLKSNVAPSIHRSNARLAIHAPQSLPIVLAAAVPDDVGSISAYNTCTVVVSINGDASSSVGGSSSVDGSIGGDRSTGVNDSVRDDGSIGRPVNCNLNYKVDTDEKKDDTDRLKDQLCSLVDTQQP